MGKEMQDQDDQVENRKKAPRAHSPQEYEQSEQKSAAKRDAAAHAKYECQGGEYLDECSHED